MQVWKLRYDLDRSALRRHLYISSRKQCNTIAQEATASAVFSRSKVSQVYVLIKLLIMEEEKDEDRASANHIACQGVKGNNRSSDRLRAARGPNQSGQQYLDVCGCRAREVHGQRSSARQQRPGQ